MKWSIVPLCAALLCGIAKADELRDLARAQNAKVFLIQEKGGKSFGYVELSDHNRAWVSSHRNWTETVEGDGFPDVRRKLTALVRPGTEVNAYPPKIVHNELSDLFGPDLEWGEQWESRKGWWNVNKWAPCPPSHKGKDRRWNVPPTRD